MTSGNDDHFNSERALVRVAAVQMIATPEVAENLASAARLIKDAASQGAGLVVLPEYFCIMGRRDTDKVAVREEFGSGPIQEFLAATAREHGIWLVGGTLPLAAESPDKVINSSLTFDPSGKCVARYDKIHLFSYSNGTESFNESRTIDAGNTPVAFTAHFEHAEPAELRVGMTICYDLRFPELYRALGTTDLTLVPSAFTYTTGQAHWEVLLRARAIENQCYILAAAQGGVHPTRRRTWGHSMLIDPWGEIRAVCPEGEGVVIGEIDPTLIAKVRRDLPALTHRTL